MHALRSSWGRAHFARSIGLPLASRRFNPARSLIRRANNAEAQSKNPVVRV